MSGSRDLRDDVCEWVDCGPGSVAIRLVSDYEHRRLALELVEAELQLLGGTLRRWEDPDTASDQLPSLDPDQHAVVVLVGPGQAEPWADWLRANREGLRVTVAFLLVLVFPSEYDTLVEHAPDFVSWAKENGSYRFAALPDLRAMDANAACTEETGYDLRAVLDLWNAGDLPDTELHSHWVGVAAALLEPGK